VALATMHGQAAAAKMLPHDAGDERRLKALLNELRVLRRVRHPNVVLFFGAAVDPLAGSVVLVYELIPGMQLDHAVGCMDLSRLDRFRVIYDISGALRYLHSQEPPTVHSDLKGGNIMVEGLRRGVRAKIIDFGLSRFLTKRAEVKGGSIGWSPPERFLDPKGATSTSGDVFPFGWLARLALTGEAPHGGRRGDALEESVAQMLGSGEVSGLAWSDTTPWRKECEELCSACFAFDAWSRPAMQDVQRTLQSWLHPGEVLELGFPSSASWMLNVDWAEGERDIRIAAIEAEGEPQAQLDLDPSDAFRVIYAAPLHGRSQAHVYPGVGESFRDWVTSPESFELFMRANMEAIRSGVVVMPLIRSLSLSVRPPDASSAQLARLVACTALFPAGGARISLRLRESAGPAEKLSL